MHSRRRQPTDRRWLSLKKPFFHRQSLCDCRWKNDKGWHCLAESPRFTRGYSNGPLTGGRHDFSPLSCCDSSYDAEGPVVVSITVYRLPLGDVLLNCRNALLYNLEARLPKRKDRLLAIALDSPYLERGPIDIVVDLTEVIVCFQQLRLCALRQKPKQIQLVAFCVAVLAPSYLDIVASCPIATSRCMRLFRKKSQ